MLEGLKINPPQSVRPVQPVGMARRLTVLAWRGLTHATTAVGVVAIWASCSSTLLARTPAVLDEQPSLIGKYLSGRFARAEEELKRVIADDPTNTVAYNYLGLIYRTNGQFPQSKMMYLQALSINANYANAQLNLGILYDLYLRDLPKALESYQRYQKMLPQEDKDVIKWIADLKRRIETGK